MESSDSSSSSSPETKTKTIRCKKPRLTTDCIKDIVPALHDALKQSSDDVLLTHLRHLLSLLQSPAAPLSGLSLCNSGFLQLLPSLLSHSSCRVRKKSAEAVGLVGIASYEVSCRLAENPEVLSAIAQLLKRANSAALFNVALRSILDVAASDVGCAALLDVAGFPQQLLSLVSFLAERLNAEHTKSLGKVHNDIDNGSFCTKECGLNASEVHPKGDVAFLLNIAPDETAKLFTLALTAVNTIFKDTAMIPSSDVLLTSLQNLWQLKSQPDGVAQVLNKNAQLAKLIMKLAMQQEITIVQGEGYVDARKLLGQSFLQKHWEQSPARIPGFSNIKFAASGGGPVSVLACLLDAMVTCPAGIADELDPWALYKDMEQELGLLPVVNQDIKLLQCKAGVEVPYPLETTTVTSRDCIKAYESGNTVVVRGLQFRRGEVAAVCNSLADELGQVTVGGNLYLTPAASQGLGVHFDDHCVFVSQLMGCKRWSVYHPALNNLPRLYSFQPLSVHLPEKLAVLHFDLQPGDVLYIPRGFLHEARTLEAKDHHPGFASNSSEWHGASLHVSFGVEVEPAFEWEGLLHVALRLWFLKTLQHEAGNNNNNINNINNTNNNTNLSHVYEMLLHVIIKSVGSSSQSFRKACVFLTSTPGGDAERMFGTMLLEVRQAADYRHAVEKCRQDGVAWLDWLRHLPGGDSKARCPVGEGAGAGVCVGVGAGAGASGGVGVCGGACVGAGAGVDAGVCDSAGAGVGVGVEVRESAFVSVVDRFCEEAPFVESVAAQELLLCKFRSCRQKVVNGLLALHRGGVQDCNFNLV